MTISTKQVSFRSCVTVKGKQYPCGDNPLKPIERHRGVELEGQDSASTQARSNTGVQATVYSVRYAPASRRA
jgi:hypothetical protein